MVLNRVTGLLWWVGDAKAAYVDSDGILHEVETGKRIDEVTTGMRCAYLASLAASGSPWHASSGKPDPGRDVILPLLKL